MKTKTTIKIPWSIHYCLKTVRKGKSASGTSGYMTVILEGRKKIKKMHKTFGSALNEVRL